MQVKKIQRMNQNQIDGMDEDSSENTSFHQSECGDDRKDENNESMQQYLNNLNSKIDSMTDALSQAESLIKQRTSRAGIK